MAERVVKVLAGERVRNLPINSKLLLGLQVSEALSRHTETMLQYDPKQVLDIMDESRTVLVTDNECSEMFAFAQISPWLDKRSGLVVATEFRSWLSTRPGSGLQVLKGAVTLNNQYFFSIPMYAVVEDGNSKAQRLLLLAGAENIPMPDSMKVELKAGEKPAPVKTFSLAKVNPY